MKPKLLNLNQLSCLQGGQVEVIVIDATDFTGPGNVYDYDQAMSFCGYISTLPGMGFIGDTMASSIESAFYG